MRPRIVMLAALVMVAIASAARSRPNPRAAGPDAGDSLGVRIHVPTPVMSTLRRACVDCHSDETTWPWYAGLPIASHLIQRDVTEAREQLDLSRWTQYNPFDRADMLDKMCQLASSGKMPPRRYRLMHPTARLSATELTTLCDWTQVEATRLVQEEK
jgi:heme-binding protein